FESGESASDQVAPRSAGQLQTIYSGETVYHAKWGEGVVVEVEGSGENAVATIAFAEVGTKRLLLSYTPLELKNERS
ncbi:hypothetical protein LCGC14_2771790, partial [marine sediment metagenome]